MEGKSILIDVGDIMKSGPGTVCPRCGSPLNYEGTGFCLVDDQTYKLEVIDVCCTSNSCVFSDVYTSAEGWGREVQNVGPQIFPTKEQIFPEG